MQGASPTTLKALKTVISNRTGEDQLCIPTKSVLGNNKPSLGNMRLSFSSPMAHPRDRHHPELHMSCLQHTLNPAAITAAINQQN